MNKPQVPAAHNVLRILTLLANSDAPLSARRIQHDLELPRSTTYHLLKELEDSGYVVHLDGPSTYGLGLASYRMAQAYTTQQPLVRLSSKTMERVAELAGGSAHLSRLAGSEVVYLNEVRAKGAPVLVTNKGVRLPALKTASGRAMLAFLPEDELRAVFETSGEKVQFREMKAQLDIIAQRGWSTEVEEVSRGQESLAMPVFDHLQRPAAAVAVTFPVGASEEKKLMLRDALQKACNILKNRFFNKR